jgi:hypothetical protein
MHSLRRYVLAALALPGIAATPLATPAAGESSASDSKAGYHLFRPTPTSLLRDLSTDRPDLTESPYSVDAGHFQLEMSVVSYSRDENALRRLESIGLLDINAKLGLLPNLDLQVGAGSARQMSGNTIPGPDETTSGFTDLAVRLKWNLWGNDTGKTAMALMPFIELPTGSSEFTNGDVEGGLIVPLAVSLPGETGLGLMVEADWLEDVDGSGYHPEWLTTATLGRDVAGPLGAFVEFAAGLRPKSEGDWVGTANAGLTYGPTPDLQLDAGVLLGVSEEADGVTFFTGLSFRR